LKIRKFTVTVLAIITASAVLAIVRLFKPLLVGILRSVILGLQTTLELPLWVLILAGVFLLMVFPTISLVRGWLVTPSVLTFDRENYTRDRFFGVPWTWKWNQDLEAAGVKPLCPECDEALVMEERDMSIVLSCRVCDWAAEVDDVRTVRGLRARVFKNIRENAERGVVYIS